MGGSTATIWDADAVDRMVDTDRLSQCLLDVFNNILRILHTNGEANQVGGDARLLELTVGELTMGMTGGMEHRCAGVGHVGDDGCQLEVVHELN